MPAIFIFLQEAGAQDKKMFTLNGYLSVMPGITLDSAKGDLHNQDIIHNRLNFRTYINDHVTFGLEMRNRLFTGEAVSDNSAYAKIIGSDPGLTDLSWNLINEKNAILNTTIDRCWLDVNYGSLQIKAGRQRINWGQTLVWNPNDVFNAYSVFDFDYPERPGSDAVRIQYYTGTTSAAELTVKSDINKRITAAGLYRFNRWGYDIQFIGGYFQGEDFLAGTGWSGPLGNLSFRGEATWFQPEKHFSDSTGRGLFTIGFDKIFKNNSQAVLQAMYCNDPLKLADFNSFYSGDLSSKDLAFSRFSAYGQFTWQVTPLISAGASGMWLPDLNGFFAGATFGLSVTENFDLSVVWQHFHTEISSAKSSVDMGFLRLKWSF